MVIMVTDQIPSRLSVDNQDLSHSRHGIGHAQLETMLVGKHYGIVSAWRSAIINKPSQLRELSKSTLKTAVTKLLPYIGPFPGL